MAVTWKKLAYDEDLHTQNTDTGTSKNFTMVSGKYLATDKVRAVDGDGLYLVDAGDNGIFVEDGGQVSFTGTGYYPATVPSEAWSKTVGSGGDYATFALCMAAMPDLLAHAATITIEAGTTLTETCYIRNKHATTSSGSLTVQAEKYWPTTSTIPTATAADGTTLTDNAGTNNLKDAGKANDYFNGCWIFIVDGTGTDNGFVPITDYDGTNGIVTVASWPGTTPDATSRYLIVGALVDAGVESYGIFIDTVTCSIALYGIGVKDSLGAGIDANRSTYITVNYCGLYNNANEGVTFDSINRPIISYCGSVGNNTSNGTNFSGIRFTACSYSSATYNGISDNLRRGIHVDLGGYCKASNNFGDNNGTWGTYAQQAAQAYCPGTECSGSSGDHSDPGTAGTAGEDQAAAYE